jgi:predicted metal-dependent phosphoesterase TrpH
VPPALNGRADLHMHTTTSDGRATAAEMLDFAAHHRSLDVVAITDHDRLEASLWAASQNGRYPFEIVPGVEVSSRDGHVLALWVTQPIPRDLSLAETAAAIHEQDGLAVLAHPFELFIAPRAVWRALRHPQDLLDSGIDAIEAFNAGSIMPGGNLATRLRLGRLPLPVLGNSDAHLPGCIGSGLTRFHGSSARDLRHSLRQGWTRAEGYRWSIADYLTLCKPSHSKTPSVSLPAKVASSRPTPR